jgi:hypothetical protein
MSTNLDSALRDALADLADAPPPAGLAAAAIRTARRRHRLRVAAVAVAVVAAALLATPAAIVAVNGVDTAPAEPPRLYPLVVTGYSLGTQGSMLLDRDTGEYVNWPYRSVVPSPDGAYALVRAGGSGPPGQVGVLDPASGDVRWIDGPVGMGGDSPGGWSPDGERLLVTQRGGFSIVDPETLRATFVEQDDVDDPEINAMGNRFVWAPGGDEIALTESVEVANGAVANGVTAIRFYDLDGNLTRTVPATAPLTSEASFSPDGTRMALQYPELGQPIQVVDVATGEVRLTVPVPPSVLVGWADDDHPIVRIELTMLVANLAGEVTWAYPMEAQSPTAVHIGSSAGLSPETGRFTFGIHPG